MVLFPSQQDAGVELPTSNSTAAPGPTPDLHGPPGELGHHPSSGSWKHKVDAAEVFSPLPCCGESLIHPNAQTSHPVSSSFSLTWLCPPFSTSSLSVPTLMFPIPASAQAELGAGRGGCLTEKETQRPRLLAAQSSHHRVDAQRRGIH